MQVVLLEKGDNKQQVRKRGESQQLRLAIFEKISHSAGCHKRNRKVKYCVFRNCKDPADNADTIRKVLGFFSELFHIGKVLKYPVVIGDGKTYEYLRKLTLQYRPALDWLILFPGDWHICKNYQKVMMKIYWHASLKNMAEKAEIKSKILKSLEACANFQRTHNFLFQSFYAILKCQLEAFFDHLSINGHQNN